ncbi:unnamed protein product [Dibothriocephalus latus]|uniref:Beta-1,4-galactosyltransferase n=1 Tax=Dibothriocephalus latus TaxID=60516 RepID=A0A3P6PGA6_DIBLA|nr:unnamed protein product [Dibothriocephalus latus]
MIKTLPYKCCFLSTFIVVLVVVLGINIYFIHLFQQSLRTIYLPFTRNSSTAYLLSAKVSDVSTIDAKLQGQSFLPLRDSASGEVAIVVPYRNRSEDLLRFLTHMLPFLSAQKKQCVILVVEQAGNDSFNRAKLLNVAVREVRKSVPGDRLFGIECFIFHDVDKVPTSPSVVYDCGKNVRQLCNVFRSGNNITRWYNSFLGAVTAFSWRHIATINGASNLFYGWGGEDDELSLRLQLNNIKVDRPTGTMGVFTEFNPNHPRDKNPQRVQLSRPESVIPRWRKDGINQTRYQLLDRRDYEHFVWILAAI